MKDRQGIVPLMPQCADDLWIMHEGYATESTTRRLMRNI